MSVFLVLIPVSVGLAAAFVLLCLASIKEGQFDDLESPRWRILFDGGSPAAGKSPDPESTPLQPGRPLPRKQNEAHRV